MNKDDVSNDKLDEDTEVEGGVRRAKKGQDDDGQIVSGAAGELFSGTIADITDGESGRSKKK